jgi:hypothetical protein
LPQNSAEIGEVAPRKHPRKLAIEIIVLIDEEEGSRVA